jgi:hypothetical protein
MKRIANNAKRQAPNLPRQTKEKAPNRQQATILLVICLCFVNFFGFAQKKKDELPELTKQETKELKKRKKEMDPLLFKDFYEERDRLKKEFGSLQRQVTNVGGIVTEKDKEIERLKLILDSLRNTANTANTATATTETTTTGATAAAGGDYTKGLVFKVQVGDINEAKLNGEVFQGNETYTVEKDEDGKLKYTLGYFRAYDEANDFKGNLRKIGIKVAWIVAYRDGKKQNMKDAVGK